MGDARGLHCAKTQRMPTAKPNATVVNVTATDPAEVTCRENQTIRLDGGRSLGYAEYGDAAGKPLLFFHGSGGSRLLGRVAEQSAHEHGIRVIAPDRPGAGLSDPQAHRRLMDWPADVVQLADRLGLDRFAVLGFSAGGPHALACARVIPGRLTASIVAGCMVPGAPTAGMPPLLRFVTLRFPGLGARGFASGLSKLAQDPAAWARSQASWLASADRQAINDPKFSSTLRESVREGIRPGRGGAIQDMELVFAFSRWGFELSDIGCLVHVWHGEEDRMAPIAFGRRAVTALPKVVARFCPHEGHMSLLVKQVDQMLALVAAQS